jgi:hypothetical protein
MRHYSRQENILIYVMLIIIGLLKNNLEPTGHAVKLGST